MKAYQITGDYSVASLALNELQHPVLLPNQILVKLNAVSLNYRDLLVIKGVDKWRPPLGRVPVSDGVGTVIELGTAVRKVSLNNRVAALFLPKWIDGELTAEKLGPTLGGSLKDGLLQEYAVFEETDVISVPSFLTDAEASTLPVAAVTAWNGLIEQGNIQAGQTVLIQGTGGVSLFSAQFALMSGAEVILLSGSNEKLELASQLGIKKLINYREIPSWEKEVLRLTDNRGADHVVEVVGGSNINKSIDALAINGTISVIGLIGGLKGEINTEKLIPRQAKLMGVEVGSRAMFESMNRAITINKIRPLIDQIYPFEEAREALAYIENGKHFGKVSLVFS